MMEEKICKLVIHQLKNWWTDFNEEVIYSGIKEAIKAMEDNYKKMTSRRYCTEDGGRYLTLHFRLLGTFFYTV